MSRFAVGDIVSDKPGLDRLEYDEYQTKPELIKAYLTQWPYPQISNVLDACAGIGNYTRYLRQTYGRTFRAVGVELQPNMMPQELYNTRYVGDFERISIDAIGGYDVIGFNWPYGPKTDKTLLERITRKAFTYRTMQGFCVVDSLTRLGWLGGQGRACGFFNEFEPYQITICSTRPQFDVGVPGDDIAGGSVDNRYGSKTYPAEFCIIRWVFYHGLNQGNTRVRRLVYDRR